MLGIGNQGNRVEYLVDPFERRSGTLTPGNGHTQHAQRRHEQRNVDVERHEFAQGEGAVNDLQAADTEHANEADLWQQFNGRKILGADFRGVD